MSRSNIVDIEVQFQHQTDGAVCVRLDEDSDDIWLPKSRCEIEPSAPSRGEVITLTTDESTAVEKGLA